MTGVAGAGMNMAGAFFDWIPAFAGMNMACGHVQFGASGDLL
jgi:hypothetical protein